MTVRAFDPVFSAALRAELEHTAEATRTPAPSRRSARPLRRPTGPVLVSMITAVLVLAASLAALQLSAGPRPAAPAPTASDGARILDPLPLVTDPSSDAFVSRQVQVLLHAHGTGSKRLRTAAAPTGVSTARVYISCTAGSSFRVSIGKAFWSTCTDGVNGWAEIPLRAGPQPSIVVVTTPPRTRWALLVIAAPITRADPETTTTTPSAHADTCSSEQLALTASAMGGALGTDYGDIIVTNRSATACSLHGYPTAHLLAAGTRTPVGAASDRVHWSTDGGAKQTLATVRLGPRGGHAYLRAAIEEIAGYATGDGTYGTLCGHAVLGTGWSITLPGTDRPRFAAFPVPISLCSNPARSISSLSQILAKRTTHD